MNICTVLLLAVAWRSASAHAPGAPAEEQWTALWGARGAAFEAETEVALSVEEPARRDAAAASRLRATLAVRVHTAAPNELLLEVTVSEPTLALRGAHPRAEWQERGAAWEDSRVLYARWRNGELASVFLPAGDPPARRDHQRALLSLLQFQADGERNETDVSGACHVLYERAPDANDVRKMKSGCEWGAGGASGAALQTRRVARYSLGAAGEGMRAVHAEEVHVVRAGGAALKARAWTRLQRARASPTALPMRAPDLRAALAALPSTLAEHALPLEVDAPNDDDEDSQLDLEHELEQGGAQEEAGEGGRAAHALAALRLLPNVRAAPAAALRSLLLRLRPALRPALLRLLGLAGTRAAYSAADALLQLRVEPAEQLACVYLAALALAPRPHADVALDVLQLAADARSPRLAAAALLAGAAAAARASDGTAGSRARDLLAGQLARCQDDACRALRLYALGNLRRADTAELLLAQAERGAPAPALAALQALRSSPADAVPYARMRRLAAVALGAAPLEVRAAALDLALVRAAVLPYVLRSVAAELRGVREPELQRVLVQRLEALDARELLPRSWEARAACGTSSVLVRELGAGGGALARLESVQVAAHGLLRRGAVRLQVQEAGGGAAPDAIEVELWTRGLAALTGAGGDDAPDDEAAAGGLQLAVAGARLPDVPLFDGQAELLARVWSGAGSEPTSVLRALLPLAEWHARVPLLSGSWLRARGEGAGALALDARAAASLWSRSARALLELRGAAAWRARAAVSAPGASLRAHSDHHLEPQLRVAADLDFYDAAAAALCVRARLEDHAASHNASLVSVGGPRAWRVSLARSQRTPLAGRTLALGRANDVACRTLAAAEDDD